MASRLEIALLVAAMLLTGAASTLLTKVLFSIEGVGRDGEIDKFERPWAMNIPMFLGMAIVGLSEIRCRRAGSHSASASSETSLQQASESGVHTAEVNDAAEADAKAAKTREGPVPVSSLRKVLLLGIPASCDLTASFLSNWGLVFIPASIYQMLRGSSIISAALFSKAFLGKQFNCSNYVGLALAVIGVVCVGLSNTLANKFQEDKNTSQQILGMGLVIAGQVVQAAQVIGEEYLLKDVEVPVSQAVSFQGAWGLVLMLGLLYPAMYLIPGADHGHLDDGVHTFDMILSNARIAEILLVLVFVLAGLNMSAMTVTKELSGVHRKMIDAMRTSIVWIFGLCIHYFVDPDADFAEALTRFSFLELFGFVVLILGQMVYSELIQLPWTKANLHVAKGREVSSAPTVLVRISDINVRATSSVTSSSESSAMDESSDVSIHDARV